MAKGFFCLKRKHKFSETYDDYHIVFKGFLHDYLFDLCQIKTSVNFVEIENFFREKMEQIRHTISPFQKQDLPSYHDLVRSCRSQLKAKPHSLISLP